MNEVFERAQRIIDAGIARASNMGRCYLESIRLIAGYAEPGYSDPDSGVIALGNWNSITRWDETTRQSVTIDDTPARVGCILENRLGIELEWSDEWDECGCCYKAVRTQPDSYDWQRSYIVSDDGEITCHECLTSNEDHQRAYLESLEGACEHCVTIDDIDLEQFGYRCLQSDFENGFYGGQAADPSAIGEALEEMDVSRYVFRLEYAAQFDLGFSVWVHSEQWDRIDHERWNSANKDSALDPAEGLRQSLAAASRQQPTETAGGIVVSECNVSDGTATTRVVSPQDFIDGKALQ